MMTYDVVMTPSDDGHWVLKSEADREIRRQKHKRCLRNAEGCKNKAWFYGDVHDRNAALTMWKWSKRWLELAEQFKEAK